MKILLITSKFLPEYSGPAFRIYNTYKRLNQLANISLDVFCQSEEYNNYKEYIYKNIKVLRFKKYSFLKINFINKIYKQFDFFLLLIFFCFKLNNIKYDIIHIVGSSSITTAGIYAGKIKKIPIFYELVNASSSPMQINKLINFFYKINLSDNTVISCLSKQLEKKCHNYGLIKNIWLRANPIDEKKFFYIDRNNFNKEKIILLNINQFIPRKNQIFLIEVLNLLPSNYSLVLAGPIVKSGKFKFRDHRYLNNIYKLVKKYNLQNRLEIIEKFVNPQDYYSKVDLYLMPSINEGLGTTFLESLACGLPVIANEDETVFQEWIKNNENGKLITLNPKKWADEILKFPILNNQQRLEFSNKIIYKVGNKRFDKKKLKILKSLKGFRKNKIVLVDE